MATGICLQAKLEQANRLARLALLVHGTSDAVMMRDLQGQVLGPHQTKRLTCSGAVLAVSLVATALVDATGTVYAIATTERLLDSP